MVKAGDGCRLWSAEAGHGTPLLLCHGGPGLWDMFGSLAGALSGHLRLIRWDQRGSGRSERRGPYSVASAVADLDAVRGHFGLAKTALLGHSWGATLALRYALDHPDRVSALVYVSGTGLGWAWREPFEREMAARLEPHRARIGELRAGGKDREAAILQWSAEFKDGREHAEEMATPWFGIDHGCYRQIWAELERTWHETELIAECRGLDVPVLIIDGARDPRPRWAVDSLEQSLPTVTRVILPGAGHMPWLEEPEEFSRHLLAFLRAAEPTVPHPAG